MARNERAGNCWTQPRRSTPAKIRAGYGRGLESGDLSDVGDIMNVLTSGERNRHKRGSWHLNRNIPNNRSYITSDCCLKNGRVQCSCLWPQNNFSDLPNQNNHTFSKSAVKKGSSLPYENKSSSLWNESIPKGIPGNKMLEEFILDDNELCLLNYYDIPIDVPKRRHVRNVGKVKTVSIIDTLSELASGATDREDEGGFSSAVSESAILNRNTYKSKTRHSRQIPARRDRGLKSNHLTHTNTPSRLAPDICNSLSKSLLNTPIKTPETVKSLPSQTFSVDDGNLTCGSLKRTLRYLRKAVSSNAQEHVVVQPYMQDSRGDQDSFRLCFSDSEIKDTPDPFTPLKREKKEFSPKCKSKKLTVTDPVLEQSIKSSLFQKRVKSEVPDWIREVFSAAKTGNVEKMKQSLKSIDPALVRNLSDDHGNNLWHICAVHNNFECLNWLCLHNQHHKDALKDENKNGFSPAALAVKHGSLLAVQWLIHNTISKSQLLPQSDCRSLLHVAARYGQEAIVEWLLGYMTSQNLDVCRVDSEGNTALHLASKHGHISCVKALILQNGNLKTRNEHGLKPLDLAVKHSRTDCADYLIAMESCYNLATMNIRQQSDIQQFQKENSEVKNYFKELLTLTKRLQHRQRELIQAISKMNSPQCNNGSDERTNDQNSKYMDDYSQLISTMMSEEHCLLMVEDKWKKSRKQMKLLESKKKPLDVLRSQYANITDKIVSRSPLLPSTPETSDDSWQSGEEDQLLFEKFHHKNSTESFVKASTPDVVNSLTSKPTVQHFEPKKKSSFPIAKDSRKDKEISPPIESTTISGISTCCSPASKSASTIARDVNLHMFFKQNPNLRQSSETCSVLEVLEPSSSDSEECIGHKKRPSKNYYSEKEMEQSSSSSAIETLSPYSCRPSSSGSKASGSRSSSCGSRQNPFPKGSSNGQNNTNHSVTENKTSNESENTSNENTGEKNSSDQMNKNSLSSGFSSEPDLIKGTQKKKIPHNSIADKEKKPNKDNIIAPEAIPVDTTNINSEDCESLEVDRSYSSTVDVSDALIPNSESASGVTIKKKSFLLKFALRGRWPSKASPRSLKNEISADEFRETYSRSTDNDPPPSQAPAVADNPIKKNCPPLPVKNDTEKLISENVVTDKDTSTEKLNDSSVFPGPSPNERINKALMCNRRGLLPPRRDPPPAPPVNVNDDEPPQDHSDDESIQKSSLSFCADDCITPSVSLHDSFMGSQSSDLWNSSDSKALFRPASSASRIDSPSRADESFPLNKSSSASTEMLSALDSSTAGRQSPAPSEVSKTESALSPPSDVSKTESTRYLSQLGRIEETAMKATQHKDEQNIKESTPVKEKSETKKKKSKKVDSDKPWYEFSDEEDIIVPQRYKAVSVSLRSSSDDEEAISA